MEALNINPNAQRDQAVIAQRILDSLMFDTSEDFDPPVEIVRRNINGGHIDRDYAISHGLTVEVTPTAETPVPGIDNTRLRLHKLGVIALSGREMDVLRAQGRL